MRNLRMAKPTMSKFLALLTPILVLGGLIYFYVSSHFLASIPLDSPINTVPIPKSPTNSPQPEFGTPEKLSIPAININAKVESVGLDAKKNMDVPQKPEDVGWYSLGYKPGDIGNAVIDGHLDWYNGPAVFWNLNKLKTGDTIIVADDKGKTLTFEVTNKQAYSWNQFPVNDVFGSQGKQQLILITCGGTFDKPTKNYSDRVVVYSILKSS